MTTEKLVKIFMAFLFSLAVAAIVLMILRAPARAQGWPNSEFTNVTPVYRHGANFGKPRRRQTRKVIIIRPRPQPEFEGRQCMAPVSVVGDQAASEAGAHAQSEKAWQQEVRFRYGERFADAVNAKDITYQCVASSIRNIANRATELVGVNSQQKRCQMQATPCAAPRLGEGRP